MKQILRLLIILAVVVGIGFGVWALFFKKDNDESLYDSMTTMMDVFEQKEMDYSIYAKVYDEKMFEYYENNEDIIDSCATVQEDLELLFLSEYGNYTIVYEAQMGAIRYYYSLLQFVDNVRSGDVKELKKSISRINSAISQTEATASKISVYQDTVKNQEQTDISTLVVELASMYENLETNYVSFLKAQNELAKDMKTLITEYALNGEYLYDAKGAVLESLLYQSDAILETNALITLKEYMSELNIALDANNDYITFEESADFVASYQNMVKTGNGRDQLKKIFKICTDIYFGGKTEIANSTVEDTEIFVHYGFSSEYYQDVITIVNYLFNAGV